jgi:hypothetical protein
MELALATGHETTMMLDNELVLSDEQVITTTAVSTNIYDMGENKGVLGAGCPMSFGVLVDENFAGATSVNFQLIASDNDNMSSPVVIDESGVILIADLTAGKRPFAGKPNLSEKKRYFAFNYVVDGTATGGKITSYVNMDQLEHYSYPNAYEVQTN